MCIEKYFYFVPYSKKMVLFLMQKMFFQCHTKSFELYFILERCLLAVCGVTVQFLWTVSVTLYSGITYFVSV